MRYEYIACAVLAVVVAVTGADTARRYATYAYEDISFARNPSAQYAFDLGSKHFNALYAPAYDLERAKYFFRKAAALDVEHPMVFQLLARTFFVSGDNESALAQINMQLIKHPDSGPSAYYIRALIYGFTGRYAEAEADYRHFIELIPDSWPAYNDLAWILLKEKRPAEALKEIDNGLTHDPENAWLLIARSSALFELGRFGESHNAAQRAVTASEKVTAPEWADMYKGNSPDTIPGGIDALIAASRSNLQTIELKLAGSTTAAQ